MAEGMAAGIPPHVLFDYTQRELYAVFRGRNIAATRAHKLALYEAWHTAGFYRMKKLTPLADVLRKLDAPRVMSTRAIRATIMGLASALGAKVRHVKKGSL